MESTSNEHDNNFKEFESEDQQNERTYFKLNRFGHCKQCRRKFNNEEEHDKFVLENDKKRFYCRNHDSCTKMFTKHELIYHCYKSEITIPNLRDFFMKARSKKSRINKGEWCEICLKVFSTKEILREHYDQHDNQYFCEVCKDGFKKIMDYVSHKRKHNENKLFECPLCEVRTEKMYQMSVHIFTNHDKFKKFKCDVCEKRFTDHTYYSEHVKYYHKGEKPFVCEMCGESFMFSNYLGTHINRNHKNVPKVPVKCTTCFKVFSSEKYLKTHIRIYHSETVLVCETCGKHFKSLNGLNCHLKIHKGEKKHKCDYCEKTFYRNGAKKEHERVHTKEKPYKCLLCSKGFTQKHSLNIHERLHTGERPYKCKLCDRGFTSKSALDTHLKSAHKIEIVK